MILVTGGTGFVGAHLLYFLLQRNEKIRAIYRSEEKVESVREVFSYYQDDVEELLEKIEWFKADITEVPVMIDAFKGVEKVYHCAALVSFNPNDFYEMQKVNIEGTAIVVNLAIEAKVKKLCYVSSIAAVGNSIKNKLITEENEWNKDYDNSGYSITKFGAEMEVWRASQEGVSVVIVNPGVILGSGFWNTGSGKLFSKVFKGFKYYTEGITGFVGVKDVVKAMIQLMESDIINERFILVAENKSFKEILFSIAAALQKEQPSVLIKPWQSGFFWRFSKITSFFTGKAPLLSKYSARSAHAVSKYSSEKIKKAIDFSFTSIDEVIQSIGKFFLKRKR